MACNFISEYNHNDFCDDVGGVREWYAFPTFDDNGDETVEWTFDSDGAISAVSIKDANFEIKRWRVEQETSTFIDTAVGERTAKARARNQEATVIFHGSSAELVADIDAMRGRYTIVAKDNRGLNHVLFLENGGQILDEFTTGTGFEDQYAHTLTISGRETKKAPIIDDEILDELLNPE